MISLLNDKWSLFDLASQFETIFFVDNETTSFNTKRPNLSSLLNDKWPLPDLASQIETIFSVDDETASFNTK